MIKMGRAVNTFSDTSQVGGAILTPASSRLITSVEVFTLRSLGSTVPTAVPVKLRARALLLFGEECRLNSSERRKSSLSLVMLIF